MTEPSFSLWRYDLFPYFLGSEVVERRFSQTKGWSAKSKSFGGEWFQEAYNMPLEPGLALKAKLDALRDERRQRMDEVANEFDLRLEMTLKEFSVPYAPVYRARRAK